MYPPASRPSAHWFWFLFQLPTNKSYFKQVLQTSPISASSSIKFRRQPHVQAKWSMFKNRSKTLCFCMFFRHPLMPTKANTRHATHSKIIKSHIPNQRFSLKLHAFSIIVGIDFQVRNLDVLGKVLGSILASISDHVGVQNDVRTASKTSSRKKVPT